MSTRGNWFMRDRPLIGWLALAAIVAAVHPFVPSARWLMVHLVVLGALTHAVMVWSIHFTDALMKVRADVESRRRKDARLGLLQAGVVLVVVGVPTTWWPLTVAGAVAVSAAVLWHAFELWRRLHRALPGRFRVTVHHYIAAACCLPVGATIGVLLARGPDDAWFGRLLVAHTMVNLLGFLGLTVLGTLVTLWPTMLRTRMAPGAEATSKRALPVLVAGLAATVGGALAGLGWVVVAGLALYAVGVLVNAAAMAWAARRRAPVTFPTLSAAAAVGWLLVGLAWLAYAVATRESWAALADGYPMISVVFVAGFALQILLGALTHLIPVVIGGGPSVLRAGMSRIERWGVLRVTVTNLGLLVCLLPVPSLVRVIVSVLVFVALLAFIPLLFSGIRAAVAARRESAAAGAGTIPSARRARAASTSEAGSEAATGADAGANIPAARPVERAAAGLTARQEASRTPTLSRLQLLTGLATIAAGAGVGVALDPASAGVARPGSGSGGGGNVRATGHTTRVAVTARGMRFVPDAIDVPVGDRLVIDLHNTDPANVHDLVLETGPRSGRLAPDARASVDAGVVGGDIEGWCSIVGHRQMGMTMSIRATGAAAGQSGSGHDHTQAAQPSDPAPTLDSARAPAAGFTPHPAALEPVPAGTPHAVTMRVQELPLEVAPGITQQRWTFNGTNVGPVLRGRVGDPFVVTLVNEGTMGHSIDFHAGRVRPDEVMRTIPPGQRLEYRFATERAGIWLYHCSTAPMSAHIAAGMHGAVIVEPEDLPPADRSFVFVQSEIFLGPQGAPVAVEKVNAERPDAVVFNGYAWQYVHQPLTARVGEKVRIWVLSAGPNRPMSFHVIGSQFDTMWAEGAYLLRDGRTPGVTGGPATGGGQALGLQTAQGGFVELTFDEPGTYPFVSHIMVDAERGAKGLFRVTR